MNAKPNRQLPPPKPYRQYLRFSAMGIEMGLSVLLGLWIGQWLDARYQTEPYLLLLGLVVGMAAGIRSIVSTFKTMQQQMKTDTQSK